MTEELSHLNEQNQPRMVDVSEKPTSHRVATAEGHIRLKRDTVVLIRENKMRKGNVLLTAELAGVQAAKQTANLIPLCHNLFLTKVTVEAELTEAGVMVRCEAKCTGQTGVEMEALTGASLALLTVYDMCKAVDKEMVISDVRLLEKTKKQVC